MGGWLSIGRLRGAPVRLHWTIPIGAFVFGGFAVRPGFWLAFLIVILVHELGHAAVVRATGHDVMGVDVHGAGGVCHWDGDGTRMERSLIAWGGVWAQLALALAAFVVSLFVIPASAFTADFMSGLVRWNLFMAAFNLLPIAPFDGAEAWKLPGLLRQRWRERGRRKARITSTRVPPSLKRPSSPVRAAWDDDGPINDEARKVIDLAAEIAKRAAAKEKADKSRLN